MKKDEVSEVRLEAGRRLYNARKTTGLSQERFAAKVGMSRHTIDEVEKGRRRMRDENLAQIAAFLDISIWELLPSQPPKLEVIDTETELKRAGRTGQSRRRKSVGRAQLHQTRASLRFRSAVA